MQCSAVPPSPWLVAAIGQRIESNRIDHPLHRQSPPRPHSHRAARSAHRRPLCIALRLLHWIGIAPPRHSAASGPATGGDCWCLAVALPPGLHASRTAAPDSRYLSLPLALPFPLRPHCSTHSAPLHATRLSPLAALPATPVDQTAVTARGSEHERDTPRRTRTRAPRQRRDGRRCPQPHRRQATVGDGSSSGIVALPLDRYCNSCGHSSRWSRCFDRLLPDVIARAARRRRWGWVATRTRTAAQHNHRCSACTGGREVGESLCVLTPLS